MEKVKETEKTPINWKIFIVGLCLGITSCDFSSKLQKEIIMAQEAVNNQQYLRSIEIYKSIISQHPPRKVLLKIYFQLGDLYSIHMGNPKVGNEYFQKVKEIAEDPQWLIKAEEKTGDINFSYLKNYQDAITSYHNLANFKPPLVKSNFYDLRLGLSYLALNNLEESKKIFVKIGNDSAHDYFVLAFYYLGILHFQNKDWKNAIKYFYKYVNLEKRKDKVVQAKFLLANCYEELETLNEAYNLYYSLLGEYPNTDIIKSRLKSLYARRLARKR